MKYLIVLIISIFFISEKVQAQAEIPFIEALTVVNETMGALQIAEHVLQLGMITEKIEGLREAYKDLSLYIEIANQVADIDDLIKMSTETYKEYVLAINDMGQSKIPLTSKEIANYISLMNTATFGSQDIKGKEGDVAGRLINNYTKIFKSLKDSKDTSSTLLEIIKYSKDAKKEIYKCYRITKACRRYVQCAIRKIEYEHGIYDIKKLQRKIDTKIEKYKKVFDNE